MVDSLSLIYSELWQLQILKFQQEFWVTWKTVTWLFRNSANSRIWNRYNSEYIRLRKSTMEIKVVKNKEVWRLSDNFLILVEENDFFERGGGVRFYFFFKNLFWPTFLLPLWVKFKFWFGIKIFHTFLQTLNGLLKLRYPTINAGKQYTGQEICSL